MAHSYVLILRLSMHYCVSDFSFLVDVNSRSRSLYAIARPSVVCLSVVCNVRAPQSGGCNFSAIFLWHLVPWPSFDTHRKFYADRPRGTPPAGELNTTGVVNYSDFAFIEGYLGTVQDGR